MSFMERAEVRRREKLHRRASKISSAFARLIGKDYPEEDPWTVDLGELEDGRPRLEPGKGGEVMLIHDDQPTTIIAYSLSSAEYAEQIAEFLAQLRHGVAFDGVRDLVGFLDRVWCDAGEILRQIPFATALRITQSRHDGDEAVDLVFPCRFAHGGGA